MKLDTALALQDRYSKKQLREEKFSKVPLANDAAGMLKKYKEAGVVVRIHQAKAKCEHCESTEITIHHLILRNRKEDLGLIEYHIQRHHHSNLRILCKEHHGKGQHGFKVLDHMKPLSENRIKRILEYQTKEIKNYRNVVSKKEEQK